MTLSTNILNTKLKYQIHIIYFSFNIFKCTYFSKIATLQLVTTTKNKTAFDINSSISIGKSNCQSLLQYKVHYKSDVSFIRENKFAKRSTVRGTGKRQFSPVRLNNRKHKIGTSRMVYMSLVDLSSVSRYISCDYFANYIFICPVFLADLDGYIFYYKALLVLVANK